MKVDIFCTKLWKYGIYILPLSPSTTIHYTQPEIHHHYPGLCWILHIKLFTLGRDFNIDLDNASSCFRCQNSLVDSNMTIIFEYYCFNLFSDSHFSKYFTNLIFIRFHNLPKIFTFHSFSRLWVFRVLKSFYSVR